MTKKKKKKKIKLKIKMIFKNTFLYNIYKIPIINIFNLK